jgi:primosomal protein N' (replication factor Y)
MAQAPHAFVDLALDLPVERLFTYAVPEALRERVAVGRRVHVLFRGRKAVGFIAAAHATTDLAKVLAVRDIPDEPALLTADLLELAEFIARYYGASLGETLAAMVPRGVRGRGEEAGRLVVRLSPEAAALPAPLLAAGPRERVLRLLAAHPEGLPAGEVLRGAGVSRGPLMALVKLGRVLTSREAASTDGRKDRRLSTAEEPSPAQRRAGAALAGPGALDAPLRPFLLLG